MTFQPGQLLVDDVYPNNYLLVLRSNDNEWYDVLRIDGQLNIWRDNRYYINKDRWIIAEVPEDIKTAAIEYVESMLRFWNSIEVKVEKYE